MQMHKTSTPEAAPIGRVIPASAIMRRRTGELRDTRMDVFVYHFSASGVETYLFLPPLVMFAVSALTSMGGLSGAFVLLPFQMSVLGYTAPGVSATNFVYNVVAIPLGVYRHLRDGRLAWPLFALLVAGTVPGLFLGYVIRVTFLPDPHHFRVFVGLVLGYMAVRLLWGVVAELRGRPVARPKPSVGGAPVGRISGGSLRLARAAIEFDGHRYTFATAPLFLVSLVVGVIGGAYGIGGGAIMAPFCISVLPLPVHVVSGAALFSTWVTSIAGALCYALAPSGEAAGARPDWLLGALFGLGGMAGIYVGAVLQRYVPSLVIRTVVGLTLVFIAIRYVWPAIAPALVGG